MGKLQYSARRVNATQLRDEIADALDVSAPYVDAYEDRLEVVGEVDDTVAARVQQVIDAHAPDPAYGVPQEDRDLAGLRTKAQAVFKGQDTFTNAQMQRIVAGIVLRLTR